MVKGMNRKVWIKKKKNCQLWVDKIWSDWHDHGGNQKNWSVFGKILKKDIEIINPYINLYSDKISGLILID